MRTYKVYYQFFKVIKSKDITANSAREAKKEFTEKYGIKPEYVLKAVDYKEIDKKDQEKLS